jgi:hypothetical protein
MIRGEPGLALNIIIAPVPPAKAFDVVKSKP